jgi:hypothetical protein
VEDFALEILYGLASTSATGIGNTNHLRENIVAQDSIRCVDRVRAIRPIDGPIEGNEGGQCRTGALRSKVE